MSPEGVALITNLKEKSQNEMDHDQAKSDYGLQADLQASIGLARGAENVIDVYSDPSDYQFSLFHILSI